MNIWIIIRRSIIYYRRTHMGLVLGTALGTAMLVGALMIGDSVSASLQRMVMERLGHTAYSMEMGDKYFRSDLAVRLEEKLETPVAGLLQTRGIASVAGGRQKANQVQIIGVDRHLSKLADVSADFFDISRHEIIINRQLAAQLDLAVGDEVLLRVVKLDYLPKDAPLSKDSDLTVVKKYRIRQIAGREQFGHLNLRVNQIVPSTVFMALSELNRLMDLDNSANILLAAERKASPLNDTELEGALKAVWSLEDAGLHLEILSDGSTVQLSTARIFLEPQVIGAVNRTDLDVNPVFTYFVNSLEANQQATPYSFVSASGAPLVSDEMTDDEIIINRWLAIDLNLAAEQDLLLKYYTVGPMRELVEKSAAFKVHSVVDLGGIYADRDLMPDFPGLADTENCRDWDPGIPLDLDKIRRKDEQYWDQYRGIPKAYITLNAAQSMWGNRFGNLTALRFSGGTVAQIAASIEQVLSPAEMGMRFRAVRDQGIDASKESVSFSDLFLGLSFFVIAAAFLLTALFALVSIEQRIWETGLYRALGFHKKKIFQLIYLESGLLVCAGSILGVLLGIGYNLLILQALRTIWQEAVGTTDLEMTMNLSTLGFGALTGMILAFLTTSLVIRNKFRKPVSGLLSAGGFSESFRQIKGTGPAKSIGWLSILAALYLSIDAGSGKNGAGSFFAAGALLLTGGLALSHSALTKIGMKKSSGYLSLSGMARRNVSRQKYRSFIVIAMLSSALFIIFTVGANRHGEIRDAHLRSSGTGGFTLFAETVVPLLYDLESEKGREVYNLETPLFDQVRVVPFRLHEGDDASCLNLNRVGTPHLLGVKPALLQEREAFTFTRLAQEIDESKPWMALDMITEETVIPGIADESVIIWGLGKAVGDTLNFIDEHGRPFRIRLIAGLANSVFQGHIIIAEDIFIKKFPSANGHRLLLLDTPPDKGRQISEALSWALQEIGITVTPAAERLMAFNAVENTYLSIFLILGGFGLILGTIGIGIAVIRNILERRGELALLSAVGFTRRTINRLLVLEHLNVLFLGILCGAGAALIAVLPVWINAGTAVPYLTIFLIFILVTGSGTLWTVLAARIALSQTLISDLQVE